MREEQEEDAGEDTGEGDGLVSNLAFIKNKSGAEEGDGGTAAADGGEKRNQSSLAGNRLKIGDIGNSEKQADEGDTPTPLKRRVLCAIGPPEK